MSAYECRKLKKKKPTIRIISIPCPHFLAMWILFRFNMKSSTFINRYVFGWVNSSNKDCAIKYGCYKTKYILEGVRQWFNISSDWFKIYLAELKSTSLGLTLVGTQQNYNQRQIKTVQEEEARLESDFHFRHGNSIKNDTNQTNPYKSHGEGTVACAQTGWLCRIDVFDGLEMNSWLSWGRLISSL